ncbi:MAG: hypothetical protein JSR24_16175 [Proteobacteria bacterium]|nr:hypothetical protein [Pseudomonadota bacterium]
MTDESGGKSRQLGRIGGVCLGKEGTDIVIQYRPYRRILAMALLMATSAGLAGCGVAAFPVRTTSAAVKIVPVAGDVVAAPLDVTADTID